MFVRPDELCAKSGTIDAIGPSGTNELRTELRTEVNVGDQIPDLLDRRLNIGLDDTK